MSLHAASVALLGTWLAAAGSYQIAAQLALLRLLERGRRSGTRQTETPPVSATLLRSLDPADARLEENLRMLCSAGAPVVVAVDDAEGKAAAAARRVASLHGAGRLRLVATVDPRGANRKIAKLVATMKEASGDVLVFSDGDIAIPRGYLDCVLAPFADPEVALVTCPYRSVGGRSMATRLDVLLTNSGFLPSVALAERVEGIRFALGATIAIRREVLEAVGGLEPLRDMLADDWALAKRVRGAGHVIALAPLLLDHHVGEPGWRALWRRHLRWARTMRTVRPAGYAGTLIAHGWVPALGLGVLCGGTVAAAGLAAYALVRLGGVATNARRTGLRKRDLLLLPVVDSLAMALYVGGIAGRTVQWGDERFRIGPDGSIRRGEKRVGGSAARAAI